MATPLDSLRYTTALTPPRILIHGVAGIGKTTFAAGAEASVFVLTEDGLGTLEAAHFPLARTFDEVMQALAALYTESHAFTTAVADSVDWLEPLIWQKACQENGWKDLEQPGYGKGYVAALDLWRQYLKGLNALRDERGMTVIQIAHTDIKRFDSPEHEPFDRYVIKLHARNCGAVDRRRTLAPHPQPSTRQVSPRPTTAAAPLATGRMRQLSAIVNRRNRPRSPPANC